MCYQSAQIQLLKIVKSAIWVNDKVKFIADWIISYFPEHKVYCEPYFGSGAVFFSKQPSYIETVNDIDGNINNTFFV